MDWAALARAAGIAPRGDGGGRRAGSREAFDARAGGGEPALLVLAIAFDPAEAIPPYSERPDEIRARFRL